jgi:protein-S-isoprenylcysteine O-methyltransferase Ste14
MSAESERELQELKQQVALLQRENARTRTGWLNWMRATGLLLSVYAGSILLGVLKMQGKVETNPVAISFVITALFMAACGGWCLLWSFRWMAEKLMKAADATAKQFALSTSSTRP